MAAKWIPILVTFSILYVIQFVFACNDVSTSACQDFAAQNPAMCDDGSCYATLCPRTCHKCALRCYSCGAVTRPENCNTTIECPNKDFECVLSKSFTHDFREVFALGCALGNVCDNDNGNTMCCSIDLCNNNKSQTTTTRTLPVRRENKNKVLYVSQHILACDDVSTSACQKFAAQNPAMCHDGSCYATLCPRTCHKCASLKCFSCGTVARPEMCNTTIECPSKDFECIIAKSFTHDFREEFALGCALRSVCDSHNNGMSCCSTDLCNNNQPTTARKLPIRRENKDKAVRQTATSCSDIHEDGCRDLLSTDPNICDTTCAKTLCPVTCGGCKQCYDCEFVSDSSHCTSKRVCQPGEYCYRIEAVSANFEHGFRLGCATDILCSKLTSMALNVFGRKRSVAGDCCHGNLCNDHIKTVTTTTMMATTQPTTKRTTTRTTSKHHSSCPCAGTDHFQVNNECFFVSSSHGTRQQGKDYCISHCGQLAAFTDESQLETVRHRIYSSSHFHNHHFDHMFVDAVKHHKSYTHPTYIWESTGSPVPTIFLRHRNNTATYNDMCAVTSGVHSTHIQSESCSANRYALCQLRKH